MGLSTAAGLAVWFAAAGVHAQQSGHATNFTTTEYYPDQKHVKSILSGSEAFSRPDQTLVVKQLKLQTFDPEGKPGMVLTAPECIYDEKHGTASSPGSLQVQNSVGTFRAEGQGFLWRQTNNFLTISNDVHTLIEDRAKANLRS